MLFYIVSTKALDEVWKGPPIVATILVTTPTEFNVALAYCSNKVNAYKKKYRDILKDYTVENDPCLKEFPCTCQHIRTEYEHITKLFRVTSNGKAFIVYQPKSMDAVDVCCATTEVFKMPVKWQQRHVYIVGAAARVMKDPQPPPLGPLVISPYLDDYNQGEMVDHSRRNPSDSNGSFPQQHVIPMSKKLYRHLVNVCTPGYLGTLPPEWVVPYTEASRICTGTLRVSDDEFAAILRKEDDIIAIEMEGVSVQTVKEILGILQEELIEIIVVKGASDCADRPKDFSRQQAVPDLPGGDSQLPTQPAHRDDERGLPSQLFNHEPVYVEHIPGMAIASLHAIVTAVRCIVLDPPCKSD